MKKTILLTLAVLMALGAMAQVNQPDAEYNLIRRSYKSNPDGSLDINFRKEIKLIRNRAITAYADKGETFITFNPAFETLTINECYTLQENGKKVVTPQNAFIEQLPSECVDCGRYNGIREMAIVHTGLEPNCVIVLDYTLHRQSGIFVERFNIAQDCPVKRYEVNLADGTQRVFTNVPQTINEYLMPAKQGYDIEFQLGNMPTFTAESSCPSAKAVLADLKKDDPQEYCQAIHNWVNQYVTLNPIELSHTNYTMTSAEQVFRSNCGTPLDKIGLLAALYNQAGFSAEIVNCSEKVFDVNKLAVRVTNNGGTITSTLNSFAPIQTRGAAATAELKVDTLASGYYRYILPMGENRLRINPSLLTPTRHTAVHLSQPQTSEETTFETLIPKNLKVINTPKSVSKKYSFGQVSVSYKVKGRKLVVKRMLKINTADITLEQYNDFREMMNIWFSNREIYLQEK